MISRRSILFSAKSIFTPMGPHPNELSLTIEADDTRLINDRVLMISEYVFNMVLQKTDNDNNAIQVTSRRKYLTRSRRVRSYAVLQLYSDQIEW